MLARIAVGVCVMMLYHCVCHAHACVQQNVEVFLLCMCVCVCVCVCVRNLDPEDIRDPSSLPPWRAKLAQRWLAVKVGMTVAFLSCIGQDKASRQLKYGHINFHQVRAGDMNVLCTPASALTGMASCLAAGSGVLWLHAWLRAAVQPETCQRIIPRTT